MMFIVYLEKISNERTNMVEQVRRQLEKFKEARCLLCFLNEKQDLLDQISGNSI